MIKVSDKDLQKFVEGMNLLETLSIPQVRELDALTRTFGKMDIAEDLLATRDSLKKAQDAMTTFCERVERGEVLSHKTYAQFCELLGRKNVQL